MAMPNFLIVGAAKSGTSSPHFYMAQHPEIYMSPEKQTYFFAHKGEEPEFRGPGDEEEMRSHLITRLEDYQAKFAGVTDEKAAAKPLIPKRVRHAVKAFVTTSPWSLRKPSLPADVCRDLVAGYRDDILKLQALLGRDLSAWLT